MQTQLGRNTVVLLGVGHTNAHVLRMWKMKRPGNAQLVCVSDFPVATYSGMLPGVIAGQYSPAEMEIDLIRLAQSAGARVVIAKANGLDVPGRRLLFEKRPPLSFDVLSIGIGSRPSFSNVEILDDSSLLAVKPMQTFLDRFTARLREIAATNTKPRIAIVGGGVGSIEIAICLQQRFFGKPEHAIENWPADLQPEITLVTGSASVGSVLLDSTVKKTVSLFEQRGIQLLTHSRVEAIDADRLTLRNGNHVDANLVIWATDAVAHPLLGQLGLPTDERGFLLTKATLEISDAPGIFAVGDSGTIAGLDLPKAGVYAVRQGPYLFNNILRTINTLDRLEDYRPQTGFLKLINLGDGHAIAEYKGLSFQNGLCWSLKNHIDRKFMSKYQAYEPMKMKVDPAEAPPMRCLGCGGKIGSQILSDVLGEIQRHPHPDVKIGLEHPDDAAVIATHNNEVTVTTDFFAAPFDDPWLAGRIAALNSASDCFVMGAKPTAALAIVQIPSGHPRAQSQIMRELMLGSAEEFRAMDAAIVGGHSIEGPRTMIGFTVLGRQIVAPKTKGLLQPGDLLILTKPIGTGVLLAAWMQCVMPADCFRPLMDSMLASNAIALDLVQQFPLTALTDVTGFGLMGHLVELMLASRVSVDLQLDRVPFLPGCRDLIQRGFQSTLAPENQLITERIILTGSPAESAEALVMYDPQTAGGLLFGISPNSARAALDFLGNQGFKDAHIIGEVQQKDENPELKVCQAGGR